MYSTTSTTSCCGQLLCLGCSGLCGGKCPFCRTESTQFGSRASKAQSGMDYWPEVDPLSMGWWSEVEELPPRSESEEHSDSEFDNSDLGRALIEAEETRTAWSLRFQASEAEQASEGEEG